MLDLQVTHSEVSERILVLPQVDFELCDLILLSRILFACHLHPVHRAEGIDQGLFGGQELWTVESGEYLVFFDEASCGVGQSLRDPAVNHGIQPVYPGFVGRNPSEQADRVGYRFLLNRSHPHSDHLLLFSIDPEHARGHRRKIFFRPLVTGVLYVDMAGITDRIPAARPPIKGTARQECSPHQQKSKNDIMRFSHVSVL